MACPSISKTKIPNLSSYYYRQNRKTTHQINHSDDNAKTQGWKEMHIMYLKKYFKLTSTLISYSCLLEHCAAELTEVWNHKMFSGIWLSHCLLLEILLKVFAMLFFSFPLPHYVLCVHLFSRGKPKLYAFTCRKNFLFTRVDNKDNCVCIGKGLYKNRVANLSWDILGQVTFQGWKQLPFHPQYTESQGFPSVIHDKHICLNTRFFYWFFTENHNNGH